MAVEILNLFKMKALNSTFPGLKDMFVTINIFSPVPVKCSIIGYKEDRNFTLSDYMQFYLYYNLVS